MCAFVFIHFKSLCVCVFICCLSGSLTNLAQIIKPNKAIAIKRLCIVFNLLYEHGAEEGASVFRAAIRQSLFHQNV